MRRAVILARVSRGERTQDTSSQVQALQAAAERKGWEVVQVVEQVKSAWDAKTAREVHQDALQAIKDGHADVLMVWALDRAVRGGAAAAMAFIQELESHLGAQLYSLQEPFLSTAADPATRELLLPIIAWVAKWESQRKSERLQARAAQKRATAEKLGQRAKWGRGSMATAADRELVKGLMKEGLPQRRIAEEVGLSLGSVNTLCRELAHEL